MKFLIPILRSSCFVIIFFLSCKSDPNANAQSTATSKIPIFLDSLTASKAIIDEDIDGMFDKMSMLDISIQMKNKEGFNSIEEARDAYKVFLRTQVEDFDEDEIAYMTEVFTEVNKRLRKLNPDLILPQIKLAKIKLDHYGADVYYTRGEVIMLPKNSLKGRTTKGQINVMLHEVWHVLSRYYEPLRTSSYNLIGFEKYENEINLKSPLSEQLLINPDGVRSDYIIRLGKELIAVPIVKSSRKSFDPSNPDFFNYIQFDLYMIDDKGNVITNEYGGSTIPPENNMVFFQKIKDNTQYIIHPDEIIADNFMLAINAYYNDDYNQFSKEGLKLVQDLIQLLKKHKQ